MDRAGNSIKAMMDHGDKPSRVLRFAIGFLIVAAVAYLLIVSLWRLD
jgi:hypothetical protein